MINKRLILASYCLLQVLLLNGQCPERQSLYKRIIYLRDSSGSVPASQKLKELLGYESQINKCGYPPDSIHALLLQRIGAAYYALGDILNAIKFTRQSINILHVSPAKPLANNRYLLKNYSNLVIFYESLNDSHGQRQAIDSCIAIGKILPIIEDYYLMALLKKANNLLYAGDYSFSFSYASTGEEASRRYDNEYNRTEFIFSFFNCKLNVLLNGKKYDLAEELLLSALKDTLNPGAKDYLGAIYEHLAEVMIYKKKPTQAVSFFRKALACDRLADDSIGCIQTVNNFGYQFYFKHLGDNKKALAAYRQALRFSNKKRGDEMEKWERLNVYSNIAYLMVKEGFYDSAFHYFQLAFDQVEPGINERKVPDSLLTIFLSKGNARYLVELLINKADAFYAHYLKRKDQLDLTKAIATYKFTDHLLDKMRMNHFEQESKLLWRMKSRLLYEHAIEACYQDNRVADAFYFLEKSRAVLLSDQLYEQNLVAQDDILVEGQLKKDIADKQTALKNLSSGDPSYMQSLNDLLDSKQKLFQLQQSIKIKNPLYYQHFIDTGFITIADVQHRILAGHNALLELYAGDSAVYAMVIVPGKVFFKRINRGAFDSTADLFTNYISNEALLNKRFTEFTQTSTYLYKLVFSGIPLPEGRIIISPDGHYFPFEALITDMGNKQPVYFLDKHAVSYTYSGRYLLNQFPASSSGVPDFLGIAPVNYPNESSLPSLDDCDLSLSHVKGYFRNADIQLFGAATKNNFMKDFARYKIIQLYTHASDGGSQGEPVIYFVDSMLYLSELIGGQKPATNLIVLSACNTGIGKLHIGEGVFSFNRGFAALGIPASISSLWSADKASTIQLTEFFYKYLDKGEPTDMALQHAKLDFLKSASERNKLPYYWAGSILAGKAERIDSKKPFPWTTMLIIAGCLVLLCVFVYRKRTAPTKSISF